MRSLIRNTSLLATACVVLGAGTARAATFEVNVPFPFVVQGQQLPAGQYRVTDDEGLVSFRGEHGNHKVMNFLTMPATGHDPSGELPTLTFVRTEQIYRLNGIWEEGTVGRSPIPMTHVHKLGTGGHPHA